MHRSLSREKRPVRSKQWPFEARDVGEYDMGVIVSGSWAPVLLNAWATRFQGERETQVARLRVAVPKLAVRVTAWDVSQTRRSLLPLWAKRVDILVYARGPAPTEDFEECADGAAAHPASAVLEELLPSAHPLSVVAIVDTSEASAGAAAAASRLIVHASLRPPTTTTRRGGVSFDDDESPSSSPPSPPRSPSLSSSRHQQRHQRQKNPPMEDRCGDLLAILVARRLHVLQAQVVVSIPRYYRVGEPPATFYEVRCELRDDTSVGWTNPRRYREFEALYADLFKAHRSNTSPLPPVPPARRSVETVISKLGFANEGHLERRRRALDGWLRALVARPSADDFVDLMNFIDPGDHLKDVMLRKRTRDLPALDAALDGSDDDFSPSVGATAAAEEEGPFGGASSGGTLCLGGDNDEDYFALLRRTNPTTTVIGPPPLFSAKENNSGDDEKYRQDSDDTEDEFGHGGGATREEFLDGHDGDEFSEVDSYYGAGERNVVSAGGASC